MRVNNVTTTTTNRQLISKMILSTHQFSVQSQQIVATDLNVQKRNRLFPKLHTLFELNIDKVFARKC